MLIAIDVGNSHTVSGIFENNKLLYHWRIKTDRKKTADELAARFHTFFTMNEIRFRDISDAVLASVVPTQQAAWVDFCNDLNWQLLQVNDKFTQTGMKVLTDRPEEVGADRIVNSAAAYEIVGNALIAIDFGTAITFDCVSDSGDYLGGSIVPGISISLDALSNRTAKLPRVDISKPPPSPIGKNTVDAIKSGILYGYGSLVDGVIEKLKKEFNNKKPAVIATGGMAMLIQPYTTSIERVEPMLTLQGLKLIHERNN